MKPTLLLMLSTLLSFALTTPTPNNNAALSTIYQFPNSTWIENSAVRANGQILVTLIYEPEVWSINPSTRTAELVHRFTDITSVFGIAEVEHDVFAVALGNWTYHRQRQPGTWSIWALDLRWESKVGGVGVRKVTDLPEATYLEGMAALASSPGTVLSAESSLGLIYKVNIWTGEYSVAIDNEAFKPNKTAIVPLGINGIAVRQEIVEGKNDIVDYLYFTNTFARPFLGRMPITTSGSAAGPVEEILAYAPGDVEADDFTLDAEGNAYVTTNSANSVLRVTPQGEVSVAVGGEDDAVVAGADSAKFGRTCWDDKVLYITTTGGVVVPPPGGIVGGKVVALDTSKL